MKGGIACGSAAVRRTRRRKRRSRSRRRGSWRDRRRSRDAGQALQDGGDRFGLDLADGDGFGEPAGPVEEVGDLVRADLPFRVDEPGEVVAVEVDAALGEGKVVVHAEQGAEHAGRLILDVGFEVGERCAVQVLDPSSYVGGRGVGQSGAFTVGGPGPPRHDGVLGRQTGAGLRWP